MDGFDKSVVKKRTGQDLHEMQKLLARDNKLERSEAYLSYLVLPYTYGHWRV